MGTDIHLIVEVKENGNWIRNPKSIFPNPFHTQYKELLKEAILENDQEDIDRYTKGLNKETEFNTYPDDGRNYDWFAVIANVRNGFGFAGVKTSDGFSYMTDCRGIPKDSTITSEELDDYCLGDHSRTWISLEDFEKFDWNQVVLKTGVIPLEKYEKLRVSRETPEMWSGIINSSDIVTLYESEADAILDGKVVSNADIRYMVQYNWTVIYREWFKHKLENWVEPLKQLAKDYEDVRIVMGFDS